MEEKSCFKTCRGKMELNRAEREQECRRQGCGCRRGPGGRDGAVLEKAGFEAGSEVTWRLRKKN